MSCGLAVAAVLLLSDPTATAVQVAPPPATLAEEPMYADIVARSRTLAIVDRWIADGAAADDAFAQRADFVDFRTAALELSERDMAGHLDLLARGTDGDLRCILRGLSEDLPRRIDQVAAAETPNARTDALSELAYLLNDNVEVVTSPPGPDAGTPPH